MRPCNAGLHRSFVAMAQKSEDLVHGWVSTDCGRGTLDILWSCLATIFLCVWTSIHLPVPFYSGKWPLTWRMQLAQSKLGTALFFVFVPEALTYFAVLELLIALRSKKILQSFHEGRITLVHGFFLNMRGFCLKSPEGNYYQLSKDDVSKALQTSSTSSPTSRDQAGPASPSASGIQLPSTHGGIEESRLSTLTSGSSSEWIDQLPKISESQIDSLTKSDTFAKLATSVQTLWFAIQVISRLAQHKATTLLEISTMAYVTCAIIAYVAWWKKPQGCSTPLFIECSSQRFPALRPGIHNNTFEFFWVGHSLPDPKPYVLSQDRPVFWIVCTMYGAIHTVYWNAFLPSKIESWMWRASCLYCLVFATLFSIPFLVLKMKFPQEYWFLSLLAWPYGFARIFMIVEAFVSLRTLPHSAYDSIEWSNFVPHI